MGLSCVKQQGPNEENVQGPRKKHTHLSILRKLRNIGRRQKDMATMEEVTCDSAKACPDAASPEEMDPEDTLQDDLEWDPMGLTLSPAPWAPHSFEGPSHSGPRFRVGLRYWLGPRRRTGHVSVCQRRRRGQTIRGGRPEPPQANICLDTSPALTQRRETAMPPCSCLAVPLASSSSCPAVPLAPFSPCPAGSSAFCDPCPAGSSMPACSSPAVPSRVGPLGPYPKSQTVSVAHLFVYPVIVWLVLWSLPVSFVPNTC